MKTNKTHTAILAHLATLTTGTTPVKIAEVVGVTASSVRRALATLRTEGKVAKDGIMWHIASTQATTPEAVKPEVKPEVAMTYSMPLTVVDKANRADKALEFIRVNPGSTAQQVASALLLVGSFAPQAATAALTQLTRRGLATKATNEAGATVYTAN